MLTLEAVTAELDRIVEEYGYDHKYRDEVTEDFCVYATDDGKPDCIVGHVLSRLEPEAFREIASGRLNTVHIRSLIIQGVVEVESDFVYNLLGVTQHNQDKGNSWGFAVEEGKNAA